MIYTPYAYQKHAHDHIIDNMGAGLFMDMGLGKTVVTLTAFDELIYDRFEVEKVLVIAPKRVAEDTWITEAGKWDHLKHLKLSLVLGTEKQRIAALQTKADFYVINRENVPWLIGYYKTKFPFDAIVIDELSSFKNPKSKRFKALRMVRPKVSRVVGLTGTPAPNGLLDLWSQLYLLDQGERLGESLVRYREAYFNAGARNGHVIYDYEIKGEKEDPLIGDGIYEKAIFDKISDICISMKQEDYLDLPPRIDRNIDLRLSTELLQQYNDFERDLVLSIGEDEDEISAVNAAALSNKLLQFANGAVYDDDGKYHVIHDRKLDALEEIVEGLNGKPLLTFYTYRHDLERIMQRLKSFKPTVLKSSGDIHDWNRGSRRIMLAHPASAGHGLNLQWGGHNMLWFGRPWSLELYMQGLARLFRQGQEFSVVNNSLVVCGTMDEAVGEALGVKRDTQDALMNAVKAIIHKHRYGQVA